MQCPTCGKPVNQADNPARPFCSERCKMIDLGKWIGGTYRIPTPQGLDDELESANDPLEESEDSEGDA